MVLRCIFNFFGIDIREERGPRKARAFLPDFSGRGRKASAGRPNGPMGEINVGGNSLRRGRQGRARFWPEGRPREDRFVRGEAANRRMLAERKRASAFGG